MFGMSAGQINMNVYVVQVLVICTINLHWSITINKRRAATESCKGAVVWMLGWCNVSKVGFENAYLGLTKVGFENAPDMLNASTGTSIWTDEIGVLVSAFLFICRLIPLIQVCSDEKSLSWKFGFVCLQRIFQYFLVFFGQVFCLATKFPWIYSTIHLPQSYSAWGKFTSCAEGFLFVSHCYRV